MYSDGLLEINPSFAQDQQSLATRIAADMNAPSSTTLSSEMNYRTHLLMIQRWSFCMHFDAHASCGNGQSGALISRQRAAMWIGNATAKI